MTINDFIPKALEWFGATDKKLEALPDHTAELTQLRADLATAKTTIGSLEAEVVTLKASLATAEKAVAELPKLVAAKAGEIAVAQGVPPVIEETPKANAASKSREELWAQYRAFGNHLERRAFYEANREQM